MLKLEEKNMRFFILLLVLFTTVQAQSQQIASDIYPADVESKFQNTKEVYFSFEVSSRAELSSLTKIISIDNITGNTVKAFANKKGYAKFLELNYPHNFLLLPKEEYQNENGSLYSGNNNRVVSSYPTYTQYEAMMLQFANDYPSICKYYELGTLPSGRKIIALKITDNVNQAEDEPEFFYTSTMHGDETAGYPMMLSLIEHLLTNYGSNTRVTNLVNSVEIWINPLANPDGTYAGGNNTVSGATRYNANGIDLNRNFPDPQDGPHPDGEVYQPETIIFMGFADTMSFDMAANFHGGAEVVNFPWDTWSTAHADENWWIRESREFADSAQLNSPNGYMDDLYSGSFPGVTNGFDWYEVDGGRQDYMQWFHHCREFTIELSTQKILNASSLANHFYYNLPSLMNYMESSLHGIRGVVTDNCTGAPIKAKVFITSHDFDSSHVYSTANVGDYHRPIYPGTYTVVVSAPGYQTQTFNSVNVASSTSTTVLDIALIPVSPVANFSANVSAGCSGSVDFTDLTGSASSWSWNFGDGNTSTLQNPSHTYSSSGTYTISLTVTNCAGNDVLTQNNLVNVTVAAAPTTTNDTSFVCSPSVFNLSASGGGTLNWYDAPSGGNLVNTGNSYTTPSLSSTTSYWVESSNPSGSQYVGPVNTSIGAGGYYTSTASHYLIFDADQEFTLKSVLVNAGSAGNRVIELRDNSGGVIQSTTVNVPAGSSRVTLNFNVPIGNNMQLGVGVANSNLYRNSNGTSYPYDIAGVVSIHSNSASNNSYYYYFYDWEIETFCNSSLTEVTAIFDNSPITAALVISANNASICPGETISFTSTPSNEGTSPIYDWQVNGSSVGTGSSISLNNLNDGDVVTCILTSSEACVTNNPVSSNNININVFPTPTTPTISFAGSDMQSDASSGNQWYLDGNLISGANSSTFTPTQEGSYFVVVTDANGCVSDTSNVLIYSTTGISLNVLESVSIYPNPTDGLIQFNNTKNLALRWEIYDNTGRIILSGIINSSQIVLDVSNLSSGIYHLRVNAEESSKVLKLFVK